MANIFVDLLLFSKYKTPNGNTAKGVNKMFRKNRTRQISHSDLMLGQYVTEYKGYKYLVVDDDCGDCVKKTHYAFQNPAFGHVLDYSPYEFMSRKEFMQFVDLGFPQRSDAMTNSPLNQFNLDAISEMREFAGLAAE